MAMRAQSLDRALPAIAGFIADRTGIPIIRGAQACTDNVAIYLPRRRSELDLEERDLVEAVAYLYHEVGHMRHSNFALGATTPLQRAITGALEDIRIEALVMSQFPAARRYLSRLVGMMVEDATQGKGVGFPPVATLAHRYQKTGSPMAKLDQLQKIETLVYANLNDRLSANAHFGKGR